MWKGKAGQMTPPRLSGCKVLGTLQGYCTAHTYSLKPVCPPGLEKSESPASLLLLTLLHLQVTKS